MKSVESQEEPCKPRSAVVVVFEDAAARALAVQFCHDLVERFWTQYGFDVVWCSFAELRHRGSSHAATLTAASADLIILAGDGKLPLEIETWLEGCLKNRGDREGALVDLFVSEEGASIERHVYLRTMAHRAGMDYLTTVPQDMSWSHVPDSLESCNHRAQTVTSVLDEILRRQQAPPQLSTQAER